MKREIINHLIAWKSNPERKPLILKGARQVGKTWALQEFGERKYKSKGGKCHYIDFRTQKQIYSIFEETLEPLEIIKLLEFRLKLDIDLTTDLLIFDEIQECPNALTSFKYFEQKLKELDLIGAGSHLGLLKEEASFPVGKVDILSMFPLTFSEFLTAVDQKAAKALQEYQLNKIIPQVIHNRLLELLSHFFFTGGLPEVVATFQKFYLNDFKRALTDCRRIQNNLVEGYRSDFTKYAGVINASHINHVFESIPQQLALAHDQEVSKYKFQGVIPKKKGFENIRGPLEWLQNSRLCIKCRIAKKSNHPLLSYCDENKFKVYLFDIGIVNCMLDIPPEVILDQQMGPFKGFLVENFVAQEVYAKTNKDLICWHEGNSEVEFLLAIRRNIIPLEVKSANRSRRAKSLDVYIQRYSPSIAYKISAQNYGENESRGFKTLPLYCISKLMEL